MTRLVKCGAFLCILSVLLGAVVVQGNESNSAATPTKDESEVVGTAKVAESTSAATVTSEEQQTKKKYLSADDVPKCNASSSNLNDCLKNIFETVLPRYRNGDAELNIPSLDPYSLNRTTFQYKNGVLGGRFTMLDAKVFGLTEIDYKTVNIKLSEGKTKVQMMTFIPRVSIVGRYKAAFMFNNVRLRPAGTFNLTLLDTSLDVNMDGELYKKDGHSFVHLQKFQMEPEVADVNVNATGIFPEQELNEIVLNIINQYWRDIMRLLLPEVSRYWTPLLLNAMNDALSVVPFDNFIKEA